jgi:hypothetical protein
VAERTGTPPSRVEALTLGSHGDTMVPVPRLTTVDGRALTEVLPAADVDALVERTRDGGAEIVRLLERGSAWWAPSAAVSEMARAILRDEGRVLPVSRLVPGSVRDRRARYVGVPARLGRAGVTEIVDIGLAPDEVAGLQAAARRSSAASPRSTSCWARMPLGRRRGSLPRPRRAVRPARPRRTCATCAGVAHPRRGRQRLAREGRLALLDDVVDAAMRRVVAR